MGIIGGIGEMGVLGGFGVHEEAAVAFLVGIEMGAVGDVGGGAEADVAFVAVAFGVRTGFTELTLEGGHLSAFIS